MVKARLGLLGLTLALAACQSTANEYYQQIEIVGGPAHIAAVEARDISGGVVLADLSSKYAGGMETGSDRVVHGIVEVNGVTGGVYGLVKTVDDGLVFELNNLSPDLFRVRTDPGDLYHYLLVGMAIQAGDVTGDGVSEQYRLFVYMEKTPD